MTREEQEAIELFEQMQKENEEYAKERQERKRRKKEEEELAKRTKKKKTFGQGVLIGVCGTLLASAINVEARLFAGGEKIANSYYKAVFNDIGYTDGSNGYTFNVGPHYVDDEEIVEILKARGEEAGFTDVETYIAVERILNYVMAEKVAGRKPDRKEIVEVEMIRQAQDIYEEESHRGK